MLDEKDKILINGSSIWKYETGSAESVLIKKCANLFFFQLPFLYPLEESFEQ